MPVWRSGLVKLAKVGLHLFYRWPGSWGAVSVLRVAASGDEPRIPVLASLSAAHGGTGMGLGTSMDLGSADPAADPAMSARTGALTYLPLDDTDAALHPAARTGLVGPGLAGSSESRTAGSMGRIVLMLDPAAFPGTYAMRALAACADRDRCAVVGELLSAAATGAKAQGPAFVYVRDRRTGAEGAWWDCQALPRANPTRCLPQGSALTRLLAEWR